MKLGDSWNTPLFMLIASGMDINVSKLCIVAIIQLLLLEITVFHNDQFQRGASDLHVQLMLPVISTITQSVLCNREV